MPGCAVPGCMNSRAKGFLMKEFPKNPKRRELWAAAIHRPNLEPTSRLTLCEIHFDKDAWEKTRVDGTRKLRISAVPTLALQGMDKNRAERTTEFAPVVPPNDEADEMEKDVTNDVEDISPAINQRSLQNPPQTSSCELDRCKKLLEKCDKRRRLLEKQLKAMKVQMKRLRASGAQNYLNDDQQEFLEKRHKKCRKWSVGTLKNALELKFACGNVGYKELLKQHIPLPSLRTLSRKLQHIDFDSGIQNDLFDLLKTKFSTVKNEHERECVLVFDEMSITPAKVHDISSNQYIGNATLPGHETDIASHALVFMLGGITVRWKQIVAYYFTGDSVVGASLKPIILEIIQQAESIGLRVTAVTCDMGSANRALWSSFNISATRYLDTKNYIEHPVDSNRKLFFLADVAHLYKNIKTGLLNNKVIWLSKNTQEKYNLPTNVVQLDHLNELSNTQSHLNFALSPKIKKEDLDSTKQFAKMKVNKAKNILSHNVSTSLRLIADVKNQESYETTAWFIGKIAQWFNLMTSRNHVLALSKYNLNKYNEAIEILKEVIEIFRDLQIGNKPSWKPIQTGILISTTSVLQLTEYFLQDKGLPFLLTSRFTQDCVENLFSIVRSKQPVPNALQFKQNLRLISVSQFMKNIDNSSYESDDREFIGNLFDDVSTNNKPNPPKSPSPPHIPEIAIKSLKLNKFEMNSFYYSTGYIVRGINKNQKVCSRCIASVGSTKPIVHPYAKLTRLRMYTEDTLFFCHPETFVFFLKMEQIFRTYFDQVMKTEIDGKTFFLEKFTVLENKFLNNCHNIGLKIIKRFIMFRLRIASKKKLETKTIFNSRTAAMHQRVR